ncbi:hypothetical protein Tco_1360088 [Tanacetum coccineum]
MVYPVLTGRIKSISDISPFGDDSRNQSYRMKLESLKLLQCQLFRSLEEGPSLELQFSLVDNSKLNVVYLLNRS